MKSFVRMTQQQKQSLFYVCVYIYIYNVGMRRVDTKYLYPHLYRLKFMGNYSYTCLYPKCMFFYSTYYRYFLQVPTEYESNCHHNCFKTVTYLAFMSFTYSISIFLRSMILKFLSFLVEIVKET
jgi:hypothetical protein